MSHVGVIEMWTREAHRRRTLRLTSALKTNEKNPRPADRVSSTLRENL
jgi:hypothetical protein